MIARRITLALAAGALLLSACAKSGATTSPGSANAGGAISGTATAGSGSAGGSSETVTVKIGADTVSPLGKVLANRQGFTLYHLATENKGQIKCTGSCAGLWPPVLVAPGVGAPTAVAGLTGKLGTTMRPDGGRQVTYNGMPLYTYVGDTGPRQANGEGVESFFAVSASGKAGGSGSSSSSASGTSMGSGSGW